MFLAVFWYAHGFSKYLPKRPEILFVEFVNDKKTLVYEDLIGFVRVREKVNL